MGDNSECAVAFRDSIRNFVGFPVDLAGFA